MRKIIAIAALACICLSSNAQKKKSDTTSLLSSYSFTSWPSWKSVPIQWSIQESHGLEVRDSAGAKKLWMKNFYSDTVYISKGIRVLIIDGEPYEIIRSTEVVKPRAGIITAGGLLYPSEPTFNFKRTNK